MVRKHQTRNLEIPGSSPRMTVLNFPGSPFMFRRLVTAVLLTVALAAPVLAADSKMHRIAMQVDQNDPHVMNLVLNNATNVIEYYRGKNEDVDIDIVAYGPGLHMLRSDSSLCRTASSGSRSWLSPATSSCRPATTPSRTWRRPRATPSRSYRRPPSFRPAS